MRGKILRKILCVLIIISPVFILTDCRKQEKCGCDGDVLFPLKSAQAYVTFDDDGSNIRFSLVGDPYSTFNLCNSAAMASALEDAQKGDVMLVSGDVFWDCQFLYSYSNYSYSSSLYKVYQVQATGLKLDLYGKNPAPRAD